LNVFVANNIHIIFLFSENGDRKQFTKGFCYMN
jgi:hypothetical protein